MMTIPQMCPFGMLFCHRQCNVLGKKMPRCHWLGAKQIQVCPIPKANLCVIRSYKYNYLKFYRAGWRSMYWTLSILKESKWKNATYFIIFPISIKFDRQNTRRCAPNQAVCPSIGAEGHHPSPICMLFNLITLSAPPSIPAAVNSFSAPYNNCQQAGRRPTAPLLLCARPGALQAWVGDRRPCDSIGP